MFIISYMAYSSLQKLCGPCFQMGYWLRMSRAMHLAATPLLQELIQSQADASLLQVALTTTLAISWASQVALVVKNLPANAGDIKDTGSIPGLGRSLGEGKGNPFWCSDLENHMDKRGWWVTVHWVTKSRTRLK